MKKKSLDLKAIFKRDPYIKLPGNGKIRPSHIIGAAREHYAIWSEKDLQLALDKIQRAIAVASSAHEGVLRKSGEPYIFHPYTVAYMLAKIGMDVDCIVAGLLHDTVEDTDTTIVEIEEMFGSSVANLVDGVTKLTAMELNPKEKQAGSFKKLFTYAKEDVRIIPIKLLDRLHNMTTLDAMTPEKQKRISDETLVFYAPLAHWLGFYWLKEELEQLSFYFGMREEWNAVNSFIESTYKDIPKTIKILKDKIWESIANRSQSLSKKIYDIEGRVKSLYSIYKRTIKKNLEISNLYDVFGVNVILSEENEDDCYLALAAIHLDPELICIGKHFNDFISNPKKNGYRSIHTLVRYKKLFIDVQIRTMEMDSTAKGADISHLICKSTYLRDSVAKSLEEMLGDLVDSESATAIMSDFEKALSYDSIDVFSPNGELFSLPDGSTLLDFAYTIHSDIGNHCIGGTINGSKATINQLLHNEDEVKVETSPIQVPRSNWLSFVKTLRARKQISRALLKAEEKSAEARGKETLQIFFNALGKEALFEQLEELPQFIEIAKKHSFFEKSKFPSFFAKIAFGEIPLKEVLEHLFTSEEIDNLVKILPERMSSMFPERAEKRGSFSFDEKPPIFIKSIGEVKNYTTAECCQPFQGDSIVAHSPQKGKWILHKSHCPALTKLPASTIDKDVFWFEYSEYVIEFIVKLKNTRGALLELVEELTSKDFNISSLHLNPEDALEKQGDVHVAVKGSKIDEIESLSKDLKSKKSIVDLIINNVDY
ncbi:MAG: RelA/SpoT family protein [bacterium]